MPEVPQAQGLGRLARSAYFSFCEEWIHTFVDSCMAQKPRTFLHADV